jgi:hypothetical protein
MQPRGGQSPSGSRGFFRSPKVEIFRKIFATNNQIHRVTLGERARNNKVEIGLFRLEEKEL